MVLVLSVNEKSQIQALDRTQPMLPLRPGQVERHTPDHERFLSLLTEKRIHRSAAEILASVARYRQRTLDSRH